MYECIDVDVYNTMNYIVINHLRLSKRLYIHDVNDVIDYHIDSIFYNVDNPHYIVRVTYYSNITNDLSNILEVLQPCSIYISVGFESVNSRMRYMKLQELVR